MTAATRLTDALTDILRAHPEILAEVRDDDADTAPSDTPQPALSGRAAHDRQHPPLAGRPVTFSSEARP